MLTTHLNRVGAAALLASAALLGTTTSTLGDPATACAETQKPGFDREGFLWCARLMDDRLDRGETTMEEHDEEVIDCCYRYGGIWHFEDDGTEACVDPAEWDNEYPAPPAGQLPTIPGPTEATRVPPPAPPGPVVTLPGMPPVQTR